MNSSPSIKELAAALAKAQSEFPKIPRDRTVEVATRSGGKYKFAYAPLDTIMDKIRPVLKSNGLAFMQSLNGESLSTTLLHTSGEWLASDPMPVRVADSGPQAFGSAITYARRYALTAILGIVTEDDDDGNAAEGNAVAGTTASPRGVIKPTDGAKERVSPARRKVVEDTAILVRDALNEDRDVDAYGYCEDFTDPDEKTYLWSFFNSKERSRLKTQGEVAKGVAA
jgi:hypothetical protein